MDLPPLQDLPNHLATARILQQKDAYPEYVFNGFLKTNSALFSWLRFVGAAIGLRAAAKAFVVLVLASNALVLPRLVLEIAGRRAMALSVLCAWPMIHHWFVSMGMLDYALGVAMTLAMAILFIQQSRGASIGRAAIIAALGLAAWLTHAFALIIAMLLAIIQWFEADARGKRSVLRFVIAPLAPTLPLIVWSIRQQLEHQGGDIVGLWIWIPPWELVYNAWAEFLWAFTYLELATVVVCGALVWWMVSGWKKDVPVLSRRAVSLMAALYAFGPYHAANWFHVGSRLLPFLWVSALVRVPDKLPRSVASLLVVCWVSYSAAMGFDYVRLGGAWERYASGEPAIPENAKVLALMFAHKEGSVNTQNMLHAWGLYVADRGAHVPLVFAHSRSFPITLREPPPPALDQRYLENFASTMRDKAHFCATLEHAAVTPADCEHFYVTAWRDFWSVAAPRYDYLLFYAASGDALAQVPAGYARVFVRDSVVIFERAR